MSGSASNGSTSRRSYSCHAHSLARASRDLRSVNARVSSTDSWSFAIMTRADSEFAEGGSSKTMASSR